jgi:hypothetical protein
VRAWTIEDAKVSLAEIIGRALANKPQRLGQGDNAVIVVSAKEYAALAFARDLIAFVQRSGASPSVDSPPVDIARREPEAL